MAVSVMESFDQSYSLTLHHDLHGLLLFITESINPHCASCAVRTDGTEVT